MSKLRKTRTLTPALAGLLLAGCAAAVAPPAGEAPTVGKRQIVATSDAAAVRGVRPPDASEAKIAALAEAVLAMGPGIDPEEAARLARISYEYVDILAVQYRIVDPPLIHNMKVNMGLKPRGLCKDWADDLQARLQQENFQTLQLHRAIANATNLRIEHSTVIVSARGDDMFQGIVLDPWRLGGILHWVPTLEDDKYVWVPRQEVFAMKRRRAEAAARRERFAVD